MQCCGEIGRLEEVRDVFIVEITFELELCDRLENKEKSRQRTSTVGI